MKALFLLSSTLLFSQEKGIQNIFFAQSLNSSYMSFQAISAGVNEYAHNPNAKNDLAQNLLNYSIILERMNEQLSALLKPKREEKNSFLVEIVSLNQKLILMAKSYRSFLDDAKPQSALAYNQYHKEVWEKLRLLLSLDDE